MKPVYTKIQISTIIILFLVSFLITGCSEPQNSLISQKTENVPGDPATVIEEFMIALEADDHLLAASYFVPGARKRYEDILSRADLAFLAADLRANPPVRIDTPESSDNYAVFRTLQTGPDGELHLELISLLVEHGKWKIVSF